MTDDRQTNRPRYEEMCIIECIIDCIIDSMIKKLHAAGYGAFIGQFYYGFLLYADDIILMCHSITTMQMMLDICSHEANLLDFTFNTVKSMAMRIGPRYKYSCMPLVLNGSELAYVEQILSLIHI